MRHEEFPIKPVTGIIGNDLAFKNLQNLFFDVKV